jgi:deoxyribodipyrimidine photolyase-related protein
MSDFCKNCQFDPKEKYGETACPMNSLYWVFIHENKATFENGRQSFVTNQVSKIDIPALQRQKELFLKKAKILQ